MKTPIYLNALRAFEASARHQSFSAAAEELNVTAAAVGQIVRSLEEYLEAPLFIRGTSLRARLEPTPAAVRALPEIRAGFDCLMRGLEILRTDHQRELLTVTVSPAFASKWLLARIDTFQTRHPDIELRLDTSLKALDFRTQRIDIGVRYGLGVWPGLFAVKLMDEEIFPVCSPKLLQHYAGFSNPSQLREATLIHDVSMEGHAEFPSWETWLSYAMDQSTKLNQAQAPLRGLKINNSAAVLQAAVNGQGIALARSVLAQDELSAGSLVRLFPEISIQSSLAYYVVGREEEAGESKIAAFRDWLLDEVGNG